MTMREEFEQWLLTGEWSKAGDARGWEGVAEATWEAAYTAGQRAGEQRECRLADALQELLSDSQHKEHPDCDDDGWCPVRDGRTVLQDWQESRAAIRNRKEQG